MSHFLPSPSVNQSPGDQFIARVPRLRVVRSEERPSYDGMPSVPASSAPVIDPTGDILEAHGPSVLAAYHLIRFETEQNGACRLGYEGIGARMRCTERTAMRHIKILIEGGFVESQKRTRPDGGNLPNVLVPSRTYGVTCKTPQGDIGGDMHVTYGVTSGVTSPPTPPLVNVNGYVKEKTPKPPRTQSTDYSRDFLAFWSEYPKGHGSKVKAFEQWQRLAPDPCSFGEIMAALDAWKRSDRWQRGFVKDAERFLSHRMWESVPEPATVTTPNGQHDRPLTDDDLAKLPDPPVLVALIEKKREEFYSYHDPSAPFPPPNYAMQFAEVKRRHYLNGGAR